MLWDPLDKTNYDPLNKLHIVRSHSNEALGYPHEDEKYQGFKYKIKAKISEYGYTWKNWSGRSTPSLKEVLGGLREYHKHLLKVKLQDTPKKRADAILD